MVRDRLPSFAIFVAAITGGFAQAQSVITTIAGVDPVFTGDGKPALSVPVGYINGVATDANGNVYFTDPIERLVLRIASDGTLSVIAGNGINSYSGDGGPATAAAIASTDSPDQYVGTAFQVALGGIAVDKQGNVYFGDGPRVRRVSKDGIITTVAGGGTNTPGNGGSATQAQLGIVTGIALDNGGNLFFAEANRIRKVTPDGTITTYAGTGTDGFSGDGGQATAAQLSLPGGLAFDTQGNLYFTDGDPNHINRVRKITTFGVISTIAGGGTKAPADNLDPLTLNIGYASGIAVDSFGGVYVYSAYSGYLFRFSSGLTNVITSFGGAAFTDNVSARTSYVAGLRIFDNSGIALDSAGNLIVADCRNGRVRKISAGIITTIAGNGQYGFGGDGGPALGAYVQNPTGMAQTPDGTIYFLDTLNLAVRAISPAGIVRTVLNNDNVPNVGGLNGIVADTSGNVFVLLGRKMVRINPDGSIVTVLNVAGVLGDSGDGGLATQATIQGGGGLTRDPIGNLFFSDPVSNRIRRIGLDGRIQSVVGTGRAGTSPDGAVAVVASITQPTTLLADSLGGVYFEESPVGQVGVSVIRYLTPDGHLQTIAGNGMGGFSGDGGPAINAGLMMQQRTGLALDANGLLYIADGFNSRVRMVFKNKNITTVVGTGTPGNSGDGGLAKNASLFTPRGLLFTSSGDLLISDVSANRIRAVLAAPPAMSVSPAQFTFTGKAGGAVTPPQKLSFASAVSGIFFTVAKSANADWLILASGAGYTPRLLTLRADPSNLKPGTYQATLTIAARLATVAPSTITVTFTVAPGDNPKLDVDRASVSFTFPRDFTSPRSLSARVTNAGTGTLAFTAKAVSSTGGNFLSVSPAAGSVTPSSGVNVLITANPTGLQPGTYTGTVTISSATTGETATVQVTMTISTLDQAIQLSHLALSFTAVANGGVVPPASFLVFNVGRGTANFTVSTQTLSGGQQWLSATPKSASDVAGGLGPTITVSVNQTGLAPGLYYGMVRIDAKGSANTPQVVTIIMRVLPPDQDPGPTVTPSELVFTAVAGAPPPGAKIVSIYNISAIPQTYVSSLVSADQDPTLQFLPNNATLTLGAPIRVVVQPQTAGLTPGVYDSELTFQFTDGSLRRAGVRLIVTPAPAGSDAFRGAAGCSPTQLVPAITTLGQSFGVPAAWPVALEVEVRDDCGNTLDSGSVKVTFSNGDTPLSLDSVQGGMWHSTWSSGNKTGPVTLTVTASDPARNLSGSRDITGGLGDPSRAPVLAAAVSDASFAGNTALAPGSIIALFGQDLANGTTIGGAPPLSTTLSGASVIIAGQTLPLFFASPGQINAVVPAGLNFNTNHQVLVQRDNTLSVPVRVDVGPSEPAIFPYPLPGDPATQGAIVNAITYAVADVSAPVKAGDIIAIFCTGLGAVDQQVPDGNAAPSAPPANTVANPQVTIGGKDAKVVFSGLAPGFAGLYQIDATVPPGVTPGNQVPVVISISGQTGPPATIVVK